MTKRKVAVWLGLAGVVLFAALALADFNTQNHSTHYQNASTGLRTTSAGHLTVVEQVSAMESNLTFPAAISLSTLTAGAADSSGVLDTHQMRLGMLLIKATPQSVTGADSLATVRLGIQIRTHLQGASDSMSVFAIYPYARSDQGAVAAASQIDTSYAGQIFNAVNLAASAQSTFSGEFSVAIAINRIGPGAAPVGQLGQRLFGYPNGIAIPLQNVFGREIFSPYTSIRVRNLGTAGPANRSVIVSVSVVGTPL